MTNQNDNPEISTDSVAVENDTEISTDSLSLQIRDKISTDTVTVQNQLTARRLDLILMC